MRPLDRIAIALAALLLLTAPAFSQAASLAQDRLPDHPKIVNPGAMRQAFEEGARANVIVVDGSHPRKADTSPSNLPHHRNFIEP